MLLLLLLPQVALAGPDETRDALLRLEEVLELRIADGLLSAEDVLPAVLVSAAPRYEESAGWYGTRVVEVVQGAFGSGGLRICEACAAPRTWAEDGQLLYQTGPVGLDEVARLDDQVRGDAAPAKSAIWIDEHRGGVAARIVDLRTGRVLFAQNIDPMLVETTNTGRTYSLAAELERRARGDSLTQVFVDGTYQPSGRIRANVAFDWTDQWGPTNANLTGFTFSFADPIFGVGISHFRRVELGNVLVGGRVLLSMPTALARVSGGDEIEGLEDPLLSAVGVARVPFGRSNFGAVFTVSTTGSVGMGFSLMNISFLPVIP